MPSVFDVLGKDHEEVKRLLAELREGPTAATGAGATQLQQRKKMVDKLVIEESRHEAVEEMYFWPAVREYHLNGDQLADEAIGQEQEAKEVLDLLDRLDVGQPEFEDLLATFTEDALQHIHFEEAEVWPGLAGALTAQDAAALGEKLERGKKTAPTRPHPGAPAQPGLLKSAGPAVAAADRLRDAISGRGRD